MLVMIGSYDLIVFYIGLELQSLSLYVLAAFNRNQKQSSEAGLKYFVLSALSSGLLLYGCSLIYGFTGSTNFYLISENILSSENLNVFGLVFILVVIAKFLSLFAMDSPNLLIPSYHIIHQMGRTTIKPVTNNIYKSGVMSAEI